MNKKKNATKVYLFLKNYSMFIKETGEIEPDSIPKKSFSNGIKRDHTS